MANTDLLESNELGVARLPDTAAQIKLTKLVAAELKSTGFDSNN